MDSEEPRCRHCGEPAAWEGNPQTVIGRALANTVHTITGNEMCADREHVAAPLKRAVTVR